MRHAYYAIRYGEWDYGCEFYNGKPMLGVFSTYYDGDWVCAHIGPMWVSVNY